MSGYAPLLEVRLDAAYPGKGPVLRGIGFAIQPGEILGLVGQSGAGKSTLALALLNLLFAKGGSASGEVLFRGRNLLRHSPSEMRRIWGREIAFIPQSPLASLNPALRLTAQLAEAWRAHSQVPFASVERRIARLLESVSLPSDRSFLRRYPRELSVGQAQRLLIAMALLHEPALLIADEATSALDIITQSEILALFARLNRERNLALLYISHDLLSVAAICHRVAILHGGEVAEMGTPEQVFGSPWHPYTQRLIAALPVAAWNRTEGKLASPRLTPR